MHCNACILSRDPAFSQFLRLTLLTKLRTVAVCDCTDIPSADLYVVDLDTVTLPSLCGKVLCCSAVLQRPTDAPYLWADRPFRPARLLALLDLADSEESPDLFLNEERHSALLSGEEIALSVREYSLLAALFAVRGKFVSRDSLFRTVWGAPDGEGNSGVVNVYIHYLRTKLESRGQKLIVSSHGLGYALLPGGEKSC